MASEEEYFVSGGGDGFTEDDLSYTPRTTDDIQISDGSRNEPDFEPSSTATGVDPCEACGGSRSAPSAPPDAQAQVEVTEPEEGDGLCTELGNTLRPVFTPIGLGDLTGCQMAWIALAVLFLLNRRRSQ